MIFGKHINKYYLKYGAVLLLGVIALLVVDYAQLLIPEIYGAIIDGLDPKTAAVLTSDSLVKLCLQMLVVVAIMVAGRFLWRVCFFGSAINVEADLRGKMFDKCKDFSQQYYKVNKVGNMMSLFTNDLETINECFGDGMLMLFDAVLLGGMAFYKMFTLNLYLTLFALVPAVFMVAIGAIMCKYLMAKWAERQEAYSEISDYTQESFSGIAVIKAFVKEMLELMAFKRLNKKNEKVNVAFTRASVLLNIMVSMFMGTVITLVIGYGGWLAYTGAFSVASLIKFISYFSTLTWPVMAVANLIEMASRGRASLNRISELLDTQIDVKDKEGAVDAEFIGGKIEFRNLSFRYPDGDRDVLQNLSFVIEQGENVGIIGKTGCGKSTLVDLILRTYNVEDGTLFVDDMDVNSITIRSLRRFAAYVPQDNFLFSDTIKNNIAFSLGEEESNQSEIEEAAMLADIHENITGFKEGYETMLGERGVTISGGQKQRTSIARALMKNASILVLDDALSAVDTKTEENILEGLKKNRKGKTTILIAHRISSVENMDKILYMEDGKVLAIGNHQELVEGCEEYRKLVELQELEKEEGGNN